MAVKNILIFVTILVLVELLAASPTRRQYVGATEASASVSPVTNDGTEWDDNDDDFDVDDEGWYNQASVSPSPAPEKAQEYNEYEDYSRGNVMVEFGEDDEDQDDDDEEQIEQDGEEDENSKNDSEFLFVTPKDTRLMLEDDDGDQSGPIKVRHTGRNSYPRVSEGDISLDSSDEDGKDDSKHQYEFTIDEDDKNDNADEDTDDDDDDDDKEDDASPKDDDSVEVLPRQEARDNDDDEDDLVSEGEDDNDMFDNPEEEAAEVIYGDHVFLY